MNRDTAAGYWITAIIVVAAIVVGVWLFTAQDTTPLVPNTGAEIASTTLDF